MRWLVLWVMLWPLFNLESGDGLVQPIRMGIMIGNSILLENFISYPQRVNLTFGEMTTQ